MSFIKWINKKILKVTVYLNSGLIDEKNFLEKSNLGKKHFLNIQNKQTDFTERPRWI